MLHIFGLASFDITLTILAIGVLLLIAASVRHCVELALYISGSPARTWPSEWREQWAWEDRELGHLAKWARLTATALAAAVAYRFTYHNWDQEGSIDHVTALAGALFIACLVQPIAVLIFQSFLRRL